MISEYNMNKGKMLYLKKNKKKMKEKKGDIKLLNNFNKGGITNIII